MNEVTCNNCGWVHAEIPLIEAMNTIKSFNKMFDNLPVSRQVDLYGNKRATLDEYKACSSCGNSYKDFRPAVDSDAPAGVTLQPILGCTDE